MERAELTGDRIGRYGVVRKLATGPFGDLWLARAESGAPEVAIRLLQLPNGRADELLRAFEADAAACTRLAHPAITRVIDYFEGAPDPRSGNAGSVHVAVVYDLVDGPTLADLRASLKGVNRQLDDRAAIHIGAEMFEALAAARAAGASEPSGRPIVHGDLNPSNVLLGYGGRVKVGDFGLAECARVAQLRRSRSGAFGYMAPEQAKGATPDERSDVYAAGIILWELLARRRAFHRGALPEAEAMRSMAEPHLVQLDAVRPDLDAGVRQAVRRALEPRADQRTVRPEEIVVVLRAALRGDEGRDALVRALESSRMEPKPRLTPVPEARPTPPGTITPQSFRVARASQAGEPLPVPTPRTSSDVGRTDAVASSRRSVPRARGSSPAAVAAVAAEALSAARRGSADPVAGVIDAFDLDRGPESVRSRRGMASQLKVSTPLQGLVPGRVSLRDAIDDILGEVPPTSSGAAPGTPSSRRSSSGDGGEDPAPRSLNDFQLPPSSRSPFGSDPTMLAGASRTLVMPGEARTGTLPMPALRAGAAKTIGGLGPAAQAAQAQTAHPSLAERATPRVNVGEESATGVMPRPAPEVVGHDLGADHAPTDPGPPPAVREEVAVRSPAPGPSASRPALAEVLRSAATAQRTEVLAAPPVAPPAFAPAALPGVVMPAPPAPAAPPPPESAPVVVDTLVSPGRSPSMGSSPGSVPPPPVHLGPVPQPPVQMGVPSGAVFGAHPPPGVTAGDAFVAHPPGGPPGLTPAYPAAFAPTVSGSTPPPPAAWGGGLPYAPLETAAAQPTTGSAAVASVPGPYASVEPTRKRGSGAAVIAFVLVVVGAGIGAVGYQRFHAQPPAVAHPGARAVVTTPTTTATSPRTDVSAASTTPVSGSVSSASALASAAPLAASASASPLASAPSSASAASSAEASAVASAASAAPSAGAGTMTPAGSASVPTPTSPNLPAATAAATASGGAESGAGDMGRLNTSGASPHHRVFVDDRVVGQTPDTIAVKCGRHMVRVGSAGRKQSVDIPCGGTILLSDR